MKTKYIRAAALVAAICSILVLLCGCSGGSLEKAVEEYGLEYSATVDPEWCNRLVDEQELAIAQTVLSSADAFNRYDASGYMSYISRESPVYKTTEEDMEWVIGYALRTDIEDFTILLLDGESAYVGITQLTYQVGEAKYEYVTTRTAAIHHMVLEDGSWRFSQSLVVSDFYVTDNWEPFFELIEKFGR